tara:strand:- start:6553 stop:10164 length:3612 start_codon:yes stop_codon:yes gene_type:complete
MNKKVILKEVAKTQIIKDLLHQGYSPNLLHRLIVEEFIREDENSDLKKYTKQQGNVYRELTKQAANIEFKFKLAKIEAKNKKPEREVDHAFLSLAYTYDSIFGSQKDDQFLKKLMLDGDSQDNQIFYYKQIKAMVKQINEILETKDVEGTDGQSLEDYFEKTTTGIFSSYRDNDTTLLTNTMSAAIKLAKSLLKERFKIDPDEEDNQENQPEEEQSQELNPQEIEKAKEAIQKLKQAVIKFRFDNAKQNDDNEEILKTISILDGDATSVSSEDAEQYKKTNISSELPLDAILQQLAAQSEDTASNRDDLTEAPTTAFGKFSDKLRSLGFTLRFLEVLEQEEINLLKRYLEQDDVLEQTIREFEALMTSGSDKVEDDVRANLDSDQEQEDQEDQTTTRIDTPTVSEDAVIDKKQAVETYESKAESAINTFLDQFMTTKTLKQQISMFTDLNGAFDSLKNSLQSLERRAVNESMKRTINEDNRDDLIKKAEKEVLEKLKGLKSILTSLEGGTTTVLGQMQKMQVVKIAQDIQAGLNKLFDAIQSPSPSLEERLIKEEDDPMKLDTREKKIEYVKSTFNRLEPKLIQLDDTLTSFDDQEGATVDLLPIIKLIDDSKTELNKLAIFFDQSSTYFTKNKISIKKLNRRFKQLVRAYISIVKRLDAAEDATDQAQVLQQIRKISKVVEKYLGAASTLDGASTQPTSPTTNNTTLSQQDISTIQSTVERTVDQEAPSDNSEETQRQMVHQVINDQTIQDIVNSDEGKFNREVFTQEIKDEVEEQLGDLDQESDQSSLASYVNSIRSNDFTITDDEMKIVSDFADFLRNDGNLQEQIIKETLKLLKHNKNFNIIIESSEGFPEQKIRKKLEVWSEKTGELAQEDQYEKILAILKKLYEEDANKFNEHFPLKTPKKQLSDLEVGDKLKIIKDLPIQKRGAEEQSSIKKGEIVTVSKIIDSDEARRFRFKEYESLKNIMMRYEGDAFSEYFEYVDESSNEEDQGNQELMSNSAKILSSIKKFLRAISFDQKSNNQKEKLAKAWNTLSTELNEIQPDLEGLPNASYRRIRFPEESKVMITHNKSLLYEIYFSEEEDENKVFFSFTDGKSLWDGQTTTKQLTLQVKKQNNKITLSATTKKGDYYKFKRSKKEEDYSKVLNSLETKLRVAPEGLWDKAKELFTRRTRLEEQVETKLEVIIERFINQRKQQWRKRTM